MLRNIILACIMAESEGDRLAAMFLQLKTRVEERRQYLEDNREKIVLAQDALVQELVETLLSKDLSSPDSPDVRPTGHVCLLSVSHADTYRDTGLIYSEIMHPELEGIDYILPKLRKRLAPFRVTLEDGFPWQVYVW